MMPVITLIATVMIDDDCDDASDNADCDSDDMDTDDDSDDI